jgi:Mn-dependent DtxR family transcriptional regulator
LIFRNNGVILPETEQNGIGIMARLSESMEDYLEAIAELIAVDGHAHTKEIAQKLNVRYNTLKHFIKSLNLLEE